jgi:cell division protease FtsH
MTMMIGGRIAEEIVFGSITTGAQNDLERITKMGYAMVVDYGMSDRVGNVSFNLSARESDGPVFDKPYSDATAEAIDEEVKRLVDEVRDRARRLLTDKRELLDAMAQALLEKEVLGPQELVDILGERPHGEYVSVNGNGKALKRAGEEEEAAPNDGPTGDGQSGAAASPSVRSGGSSASASEGRDPARTASEDAAEPSTETSGEQGGKGSSSESPAQPDEPETPGEEAA